MCVCVCVCFLSIYIYVAHTQTHKHARTHTHRRLRLGGIDHGGEAGERDIDLECVLIECVPYTGDLDWTEFTMVAKQASFLNIIQVANVLLVCCSRVASVLLMCC